MSLIRTGFDVVDKQPVSNLMFGPVIISTKMLTRPLTVENCITVTLAGS